MNNDLKLSIYEQQLENLDDPDGPDDLELAVFQVLNTRDALAGVTLARDEQQRLADLDVRLHERGDVIAHFLPVQRLSARDCWWWFLHEKEKQAA